MNWKFWRYPIFLKVGKLIMPWRDPVFLEAGKLLGKQLFLPALCAFVFAAYGYFKVKADLYFALSSFVTAIFIVSGLANYYYRAKKHVEDKINHKSAMGKHEELYVRLAGLAEDSELRQRALTTKLEELATDLRGNATGGDSFAYVHFVRTKAGLVQEFSTIVAGKYALQDVTLKISTFESMRDAIQELQRTGNHADFYNSQMSVKMGYMLPGMGYPVATHVNIIEKDWISFHLNWYGRNGTWYQRIQMEKIEGNWRMATYVKRDREVIYSNNDDEYPLDADGRPIFHEYGER